MAKSIIGLGEFCESVGMPITSAVDVMHALHDKHVLDCAVMESKINRISSGVGQEAVPLRDDGDDFGTVEARGIPGKLFFQLCNQENFGREGFMSDEGMKDFLKAYPQFRVKTVSGRVCGIGFGAGRKTVKRYDF